MAATDEPTPNITPVALVFELGLAAVAIIVGWLIGYSPVDHAELTTAALPRHAFAALWGIVAAGPMIGGLLLIDRFPIGALRDLKRLVDQRLLPLFAGTSIGDLACISIAAGVGEEMLFRGLVQGAVAHGIGGPAGMWIGLAVGSVLFGVCHWLTPLYALLATLIGLYIGGVYIAADSLVAPIVVHALYDFVALLYLTRGEERQTA